MISGSTNNKLSPIGNMDMIERAKNLFGALASVTALLYASGYIVETFHDKMLGITIVNPSKDAYLISGGEFFFSTLYAVFYTTLGSGFLDCPSFPCLHVRDFPL